MLDRLEANRQAGDEAGLDQRLGAIDLGRHALGDLGNDLDAGFADLGVSDVADRLTESCCHSNGIGSLNCAPVGSTTSSNRSGDGVVAMPVMVRVSSSTPFRVRSE